jgi:hypothetical protein
MLSGEVSLYEVVGPYILVLYMDTQECHIQVRCIESIKKNLIMLDSPDTTTGTPLQQHIDALPYAHISVAKVYTNGFSMRCRWWRC